MKQNKALIVSYNIFFSSQNILEARAEIKEFFLLFFLEELKDRKNAFEIVRPLN